ncbi:MAG TPA: hypothetical protein VKA67_01975 [Verrucomicrobiae bacterium]|nr:hypothetical protein [Verrucomicrobiae bacterium]
MFPPLVVACVLGALVYGALKLGEDDSDKNLDQHEPSGVRGNRDREQRERGSQSHRKGRLNDGPRVESEIVGDSSKPIPRDGRRGQPDSPAGRHNSEPVDDGDEKAKSGGAPEPAESAGGVASQETAAVEDDPENDEKKDEPTGAKSKRVKPARKKAGETQGEG